MPKMTGRLYSVFDGACKCTIDGVDRQYGTGVWGFDFFPYLGGIAIEQVGTYVVFLGISE